jgi:hypothetical protein
MEEEIDFCKEVEKLVENGVHETYIEAVLFMCEDQGMEPFMGARLLTKPIKEKIQKEGQDINLLPKTAMLPMKKNK